MNQCLFCRYRKAWCHEIEKPGNMFCNGVCQHTHYFPLTGLYPINGILRNVRLFLYLPLKDALYEDLILALYPHNNQTEYEVYRSLTEIDKIKQYAPTIGGGDLEIKESSIDGAGFGIFVKRNFEANEIITYYDGPIVQLYNFKNLIEKDPRYKTHARSHIHGFSVQVGNQTKEGKWITNPSIELLNDGIGAYLNDAISLENNTEFKIIDGPTNNKAYTDVLVKSGMTMTPDLFYSMKYTPLINDIVMKKSHIRNDDRLTCIIAKRPIQAGEELFISYGDTFWK